MHLLSDQPDLALPHKSTSYCRVKKGNEKGVRWLRSRNAHQFTMESLSSSKNEPQLHQDVVSQFPLLNAYTNYLAIFKLDDSIPQASVVSAFRTAFDELKAKVPWLGHHVENIGSGPGNSGYFASKPWPAHVPRHDFFVKQCADVIAPFAVLEKAGFPVSMIPADVTETWPSLPVPATIRPAPVAALQLNFIQGGLILTVTNHHTMIDGTGLLVFRRMLATLMDGRPIPEDDIAAANLDRTRVIPLLAPGEPIKDHSHLIRRPQQSPPVSASPPPSAKWRVFRITRKAAVEIRSLAGDRNSPAWIPTVPRVSTNDVLAAFCWQRIAAARLPILLKRRPHERSPLGRFGRAIDARRTMGIPSSYMGHMVYHAVLWLPLETVASTPLPFLACALRQALNEANNPWAVRSYATFLSREPDRSRLLYGGPQNPETDIGLSSLVTSLDWERQPTLRFGPLLGSPVAWRKANHAPFPGCVYFLDTERKVTGEGGDRDGNEDLVLTTLLCLAEDELDALRRDSEWMQYFEEVVEPAVDFRKSSGNLSKL